VQHDLQPVVAPQLAGGDRDAEGVAGHDDLGQRGPRHGPAAADDLAVHDLGRGRQVEEVGERAGVAADDDLAGGQDGHELR